MSSLLQPLQLLLTMFAGWVNRVLSKNSNGVVAGSGWMFSGSDGSGPASIFYLAPIGLERGSLKRLIVKYRREKRRVLIGLSPICHRRFFSSRKSLFHQR